MWKRIQIPLRQKTSTDLNYTGMQCCLFNNISILPTHGSQNVCEWTALPLDYWWELDNVHLGEFVNVARNMYIYIFPQKMSSRIIPEHTHKSTKI
jgi:hypothetical protein